MTPPRTLSTADVRRDELLEAAMVEFAERGFHGTPTTAIAKRAGISQAYLFRLFPTKAELAVATIARCMQRIEETFVAAAAQAPKGEEIPAMGMAYTALIADRKLLLLQLHGHAASPEMPEVRDALRTGWARLVALVQRVSDADDEEVQRFMAHGMLCNTIAALVLQDVDEPYARLMVGEMPPDA